MAGVNTLRLYFSTVRHLKTGQLFHLAKQRLLPRPKVSTGRDVEYQVREGTELAVTLSTESVPCGDYTFRFLNVSRSFSAHVMDWVCADMPKLWRYNLHYFDYLQDDGRTLESRAKLVSNWIANNPMGAEDAWEPYTVSLRVVNWIKWFLRDNTKTVLEKEWLQSLYIQAAWLEKNIEYHLLANHYLKNAKALVFAGAFFDGVDADRWLRKGLKILHRELLEQILPDGGHCERSPMYHCLVVEDLLDVLNLALSNAGLVSADATAMLQERTVAALGFRTPSSCQVGDFHCSMIRPSVSPRPRRNSLNMPGSSSATVALSGTLGFLLPNSRIPAITRFATTTICCSSIVVP